MAPSELVPAVISRIKALHDQFSNFIVLCKDVEILKQVEKALEAEANEHIVRDRRVVVFDQFERNHSATGADLRSLKTSNFIVLTTKDGGIAVYY